jgi:uncharacterized protein (UPF0305 family)
MSNSIIKMSDKDLAMFLGTTTRRVDMLRKMTIAEAKKQQKDVSTRIDRRRRQIELLRNQIAEDEKRLFQYQSMIVGKRYFTKK